MAEPADGKRPIGRIRLIGGLILIVLGVAYWARMAWFWALYGSQFGQDDWIRFVFIIWLGIVLALIGCWLAFRLRIAVWAAALVVLAALAFLAALFVSHGH